MLRPKQNIAPEHEALRRVGARRLLGSYGTPNLATMDDDRGRRDGASIMMRAGRAATRFRRRPPPRCAAAISACSSTGEMSVDGFLLGSFARIIRNVACCSNLPADSREKARRQTSPAARDRPPLLLKPALVDFAHDRVVPKVLLDGTACPGEVAHPIPQTLPPAGRRFDGAELCLRARDNLQLIGLSVTGFFVRTRSWSMSWAVQERVPPILSRAN